MAYHVPKGLHYCCVDGQIVFMDLRTDAYFLLKGAPDRAFRLYLSHGEIDGDDLKVLLAKGVLVEGDLPTPAEHTPEVPVPRQSASELALGRMAAGPALICEVAYLVYGTRRRLRTRNIGELLDAHVDVCRGLDSQDDAGRGLNAGAFAHAAGLYRAARRFVPVEHSCLLDSLALDRFLAKRGMESRLVFGVNAEPFSAHAWL